MGQLQSKEECFYLRSDLDKAIDDKLWKQKTGFNLANYNMDESLSELSICLEERTESSPLRVELPPRRSETETSKLLTMDHEDAGNHDNGGRNDRSKLNIEEFECGVHFECSENAKQEWAFTLYDFDGHGRITKEDLASLLKALYDAVGSSIKLPPNGAKTLKLRLTVGQESVSHLQNPNIKSTERSKTPNKTSKHKVREFSRLNNLARAHVKRTNESQCQRVVVNQETTPTTTQAEKKIVNSQPGMVSHVSGPEHQHLLDLVHENLAQNQGRPLRKHQNDSRNDAHNRHKRQHRTAALHCPTTSAIQPTTSPPHATSSKFTETGTNNPPKESQDRRDYYLDLAGVECNSSRVLNNLCLTAKGASCLRTGNGKNKLRSRDVSVGATNGLVPNDQCDVPSRLPKEKCNISSRLARGKCDVSSRLHQDRCSISQNLTHEKCGLFSNLTQEKCGISSNITQEKCGISSNITQEKCGISSNLTQEKCVISSNLTQEKCVISSNLTQEKCEISSRLGQEKCGVSSNLTQDGCDISQHLTQKRCGISHLTPEKCDISSHLSQEKCGISSRMMKEKCGISSRLAQAKCGISVSMHHNKCESSSTRPLEKWDLVSGLSQGNCDASLGFLQENGDICLCLPQEKRDEGSRLTTAKCDTSLHLPRNKCDVNSRTLQEKPALSSTLQQGTCNISSRLPLGKCDNLVRQEGERTASKQPHVLPNNQHLRSKSLDVPENPQAPKSTKPKKPKGWLNFNGGRFRPVSLPGKEPLTVLPDCHRRHRHREKDRDVMMQQVAEWIEREHVDGAAAARVIVQRHEHHHIHEHHHHHHFHHHHDT